MAKKILVLEDEVKRGDAHVKALEEQSEADGAELARITEQATVRITDLEQRQDAQQEQIDELEAKVSDT